MYFYSSGTEYISQEVLNKIKDKSMYHNILRIQYNDSIVCGSYCIVSIEYMIAGICGSYCIAYIEYTIAGICGSYCIVSIEYMIAGKTLLDYTYFFLLTTIKGMANMTIYKYFKVKYGNSLFKTKKDK